MVTFKFIPTGNGDGYYSVTSSVLEKSISADVSELLDTIAELEDEEFYASFPDLKE